MANSSEQIHGHAVTIEHLDGDQGRVRIGVGARSFEARLDEELGWSCGALPFVGHASPRALAEALAVSYTRPLEEEG